MISRDGPSFKMLLDDFQRWASLSFYYELMITRSGPPFKMLLDDFQRWASYFLTMTWWFKWVGHLLKCNLMIFRGGSPYLCTNNWRFSGLYWFTLLSINWGRPTSESNFFGSHSIFVLLKLKLFGLLPLSNIFISVWRVFSETTTYLLLEWLLLMKSAGSLHCKNFTSWPRG